MIRIPSKRLGTALLTAISVVAVSGCVPAGAPTADQVAAATDTRVIGSADRPALDGQSEWAGRLAAAGMDMTAVARDERGWLILWQLIGEDPPGALPEGSTAAAVFLGARPTDGYSVQIDEVLASDNGMIVRYSETQPPPGADVTDAVIAPYTLVLLPATDSVVHFERNR